MRTVRATARCQFCDWKVKATGDDVVEVGTFLRRLCIEHTEAEHADELAHDRQKEDACDSSK